MQKSNLATRINAYYLLCIILFQGNLVTAQKDPIPNGSPRTEYHQYPDHYEKITYYGKKDRYCTVSWYLPDSSLKQINTYKMVDKAILGYRFDQTKAAVKQGLSEIRYSGGQVYLRCYYTMNALDGPFVVFYPDGAIKRREFYKNGYLKESHCYNPDGTEQLPCAPYYQQAQFIGDVRKLDKYLSDQLQTIIDGQWVIDLQINLTISEIGQVKDISLLLDSGGDKRTPKLPSDIASALSTKVQQMIKSLPESDSYSPNWKPATADGVPTVGNWKIYVDRTNYYVRIKHD